MKAKLLLFILLVTSVSVCFLSLSCDLKHALPALAPLPTPTPTPAPPVTITYGGSFNFNPMSVTILQGGTVFWDSTFGCGHTLNIDNGAGACVTNYTCYPVTYSFPSPGTYTFHCNYHSGCSSGCTGCTGMFGTVVVQ
jgi:plastocyanin